jgi:phospholipase C
MKQTLSIIIFTLICSFALSGQNSKSIEVNIVSWNIQMLPNGPQIFSKSLQKKQRVREPEIVKYCNDNNFDIIVFQEVFDLEIKRKLKRHLQKVYPYQISTKSKFGRLTSNGVLIVSRFPIKYVDHVIYHKGVSEDGWAAKGCTLIEAEKEGVVFQIAGTHLQSGNSDEAIEHRHSQYQEITDLLSDNHQDNIPVFVLGDMNTRKSDTINYELMLHTIGVKDSPINEEEPFTIDGKNSWNSHEHGIQLDYILLDNCRTSTAIIQQKIIRPKFKYKNMIIDLADHYGVVAKVKISN